MINFLTIEDINGTIYENQDFYYHTIDTSVITVENTPVTIDFCKVTRTSTGYNVVIDNSYWAKGYYILDSNGDFVENPSATLSNNTLSITTTLNNIKIVLYCGCETFDELTPMTVAICDTRLNLTYKELNTAQTIHGRDLSTGSIVSDSLILDTGFNEIPWGFLWVNLVKSDFQFQCTQSLTLGKVNTVKLGVDDDYKPSGEMIGDNVPTINVKYGSTYIPVTYDSALNDYVFNLDLTNKQTEGKVRFNVIVDTNDVLNNTETEVTLNSSFETINNESKLTTLFRNGGIGRLGANITLTNDLTLTNDVLIIGNTKTLNMNNHKIIVPTEKTFKANETLFTNGYNTIQQYTESTVELNSCTFTNCTGLGSVIDCQIDIESLEMENDFTTTIIGCTFTNNDMCILHGGELTIENCTITGKIGNPSYPYFLYQTDGNAVILQSTFDLSSNTQISTDIEFNSCIFICGETATINGYDHTQLQNNNITAFTTTQRNTSTINVTYYYPTIEDYITLQSDKGYCHTVSNVDYVFKNGVTARRTD